jgi:hypothetical protein
VFVVRRDQNIHGHRVFPPIFEPDWFSTLFIWLLREQVRKVVVKLKRLGRPAVSFTFQFFLV